MGFSEHTDTIFNGTGLHQITETGESKQDTPAAIGIIIVT